MEYGTTQAHVPPGWYPDPATGGVSERYWDGLAWSQEFTRPGPPQAAPPAAPQYVQQNVAAQAPTGQKSTALPIVLMVIGALLTISRVLYIAKGGATNPSADAAYNQGAQMGSVVGMALGAALFSNGLVNFREANGHGSSMDKRMQILVLTLAITVIGFIAASALGG